MRKHWLGQGPGRGLVLLALAVSACVDGDGVSVAVPRFGDPPSVSQGFTQKRWARFDSRPPFFIAWHLPVPV